jgi:hypothetical protein
LKSASVRNVVHSRKISLKAEDVLGLPQKYRLEFCLARLISATDAKIKEKLLEGVLAEDLGL